MFFLLLLLSREEESEIPSYVKRFVDITNLIYNLGAFELSDAQKETLLQMLNKIQSSSKLNELSQLPWFDERKSKAIASFIEGIQEKIEIDDEAIKHFEKLIDLINDLWVEGDVKKFIKAIQTDGILKALPKLGFEIDELEDIIYILKELNNENSNIKFGYFYDKFKQYTKYDINDLLAIAKKVINKRKLNLGVIDNEIVNQIKKISEIPFNLLTSLITILDGILKPFYKMFQQDKLKSKISNLIDYVTKFDVPEELNDFKNNFIFILNQIIGNGKNMGIFTEKDQFIVNLLSSSVTQGGLHKLILSIFKETDYEDFVNLILENIDDKTLEFDDNMLDLFKNISDKILYRFTIGMIETYKNPNIGVKYEDYRQTIETIFAQIYDEKVDYYKSKYEQANYIKFNALIGPIKVIMNAIKKVTPALEPLLGPFYKILPPVVDIADKLITLISEESNFEKIISNIITNGNQIVQLIDGLYKNGNVSKYESDFLNIYKFIEQYIKNFGFTNPKDIVESEFNKKYKNAMYKLCSALEGTKAYNSFPVIKLIHKISAKVEERMNAANSKRSVLGKSGETINYKYLLKTISSAGDIFVVNIFDKATNLVEEVTDIVNSKGDAISFSRELFNNDALVIVGNTAKAADAFQTGDANTIPIIQEASKNIEEGIKNSKKSSGPSSGAIAGIVIACIVVVAAIACGAIFLIKRNKGVKSSGSGKIEEP